MITKAEIFDKITDLYEITGFNDHSLHSVIKFRSHFDEIVMEKAMKMLLKTVPILSSVYIHDDKNPYWESVDISKWKDLIIVVDNEVNFNRFTTSKIDGIMGPQIKACILKADQDSLSIVMNHMVCDAAGFKECLYLLAFLYSKIMENSNYCLDFEINGERSFKKINSQFAFAEKLKTILFENKENNQSDGYKFPLSNDKNIEPFILSYELGSDRYAAIR